MDKKILCTVKVHSMVDIITNSSTEIFCTVKGKSEEDVYKILQEIVREFGCEILENKYDGGLMVSQKYDWSSDKEVKVEGEFEISYEYHNSPCKAIRKRISEVFETVETR